MDLPIMDLPKGVLKESRLINHRGRAGLPQWKVALATKIPASRLSLLEQGAPPKRKEIQKLTDFYGVSASEIWPELEG